MAFSRMTGPRLRSAAIVRLVAIGLFLSALCLAFVPGHARAFCQGSGCLPGSGYTLDEAWNCGQIHSEVNCYYNGVTSLGSAITHTWGFGSASYSGEGNDDVRIDAHTLELSYFGGWGTNLSRACFNDNCNDQDAILMYEDVGNAGFHTISGHGEA